MKRVVKVLVVTALIAVVLATSITPALARTSHFGKRLTPESPCVAHRDMANAQNGRGAQILFAPEEADPPVVHQGCWLVLPGQDVVPVV
jgi:hypothetical protein